jgi:hypothetical protein
MTLFRDAQTALGQGRRSGKPAAAPYGNPATLTAVTGVAGALSVGASANGGHPQSFAAFFHALGLRPTPKGVAANLIMWTLFAPESADERRY